MPPPRLGLSDWIERTVHLPAGLAATPGPLKLWAFQRELADSIGDPTVERISILKATRIGYSSLLGALTAHHAINDPTSVLCVLPTESDCRNFMVGTIEPLFASSPSLAGRLKPPSRRPDQRSTILHRLFDSAASLKLVAARAPRNLRAHTCRVLLLDEIDGMELTAEGDPIALAEKRTLSFQDRKIVAGSTPTDESTSAILRLYNVSDMRVFEIACPRCKEWFEIKWKDIVWPEGEPEKAHCICPACEGQIDERDKNRLVEAGRWRATQPEVKNHRGYKLSALVSPLPNASWARLAQEFLSAKSDPDLLRVFLSTLLAEPWRDQGDEIDEDDLASRREDFDLENIPAEVLAVTIGIDVQQDRFEASVLGHAKDGTIYVLAHQQIWGDPSNGDDDCWKDLDALLRERWQHARGGMLRVDAAAIDVGDGHVFDVAMKFCAPRLSRKVLGIKGVAGFGRPMIQASKSKRQGARLFLVAVDVIKGSLFTRLARGASIRFSHTLEAEYFVQLTSEVRRVRYSRGRPTVRFERKQGARAEALDCATYGIAAKAALSLNFDQRATELAQVIPPTKKPDVFRSRWMDR
jgi:phage terminase large subunit GpA-like protein